MLSQPEKSGTESAFEIGRAAGRLYTYDGRNTHRVRVSIATKRAYYNLTITARDAKNEVLRAMLASIRVDGQRALTDVKTEPPVPGASTNVKDLDVSDLVREALKRKQTDRVETVALPFDYVPAGSDTVFSRPVLVVRNRPATYSAEARDNMLSGAVRLRIQLKANGNVGSIVVLKGLPFGLTARAVQAASEIKFVPAEVDGRPADAYITREYTFRVY